MLLEAMRATFAFGKWSAKQFAAFLDRHEAYFPKTFSRPSFLDNHDMNRFLWVAHGDIRKLKLAALCQFTLIGPPIIYYGTEVALSQNKDVMQRGHAMHKETRLPMIWGDEQDRELFNFYKDLIALRKAHSCLRYGTRTNIYADEHIFAYRQRDATESLVMILNISEQQIDFELEITESGSLLATNQDCKIQANENRMRILLPPHSGIILQ